MAMYRHGLRPANTRVRDYNVTVAGQSLARALTNRSSWPALCAQLRAGGLTAALVNQVNTAVGGSVADKWSAYSPATNTTFWYDSVTSSNGPLLTAALAAIGATAGDALVFDLGQTESLYVPDVNSVANFRTAWRKTAEALLATVPSKLIVVPVIGRRSDASAPGVQLVREGQIAEMAALTAGGATVRRFDTYDLSLIDTVHPDQSGYAIYGSRLGRCVRGLYSPPKIAAVTRGAGVLNLALDAAVTSAVGLVVQAAGARLADGTYKFMDVTVTSATTMTAAPVAGAAWSVENVSEFLWPYDKLSRASILTLPRNAAGDPIESCSISL